LQAALDRRIKFLIKFHHLHYLRVSKKQLLELQHVLRKKAIAEQDGMLFQAMSVAIQCIKINHALELIQSQGLVPLRSYLEKIVKGGKKTKAGRSILEDEDIQQAVAITESLYERGIDHPKFETLQQILKENMTPEKKAIVFTQYVDTVNEIVKKISALGSLSVEKSASDDNEKSEKEKNVAEKTQTTKLPKIRAVKFIGQRKGLTQKRQISILRDFRDGLYNVLVATSIGEEGLDLPSVDLVIFFEPVPSEIRSIQRRGRTGRFAPGEIFILMAKDTIDEAYYWSAYHKEKRMKAILYDMQDEGVAGGAIGGWTSKKIKQKGLSEF